MRMTMTKPSNNCVLNMPSEDTKILELNQYQKSDRAPFIVYADLECLVEKIDGRKNNPENSSTTIVSNHSIRLLSFYNSII